MFLPKIEKISSKYVGWVGTRGRFMRVGSRHCRLKLKHFLPFRTLSAHCDVSALFHHVASVWWSCQPSSVYAGEANLIIRSVLWTIWLGEFLTRAALGIGSITSYWKVVFPFIYFYRREPVLKRKKLQMMGAVYYTVYRGCVCIRRGILSFL